MQAPVFSLHMQQIRAHLLLGIWDTLVMGSIFSGFPMLTWAQDNAWSDPRGELRNEWHQVHSAPALQPDPVCVSPLGSTGHS